MLDAFQGPRKDPFMDTNPLTDAAVHYLTRIGMQTDDILKRNMGLARDVSWAREAGATWNMIGMALGTTGQAAWQRFRPVAAGHENTEPQLPFDASDDSDEPIEMSREYERDL